MGRPLSTQIGCDVQQMVYARPNTGLTPHPLDTTAWILRTPNLATNVALRLTMAEVTRAWSRGCLEPLRRTPPPSSLS
jgi:hypothetical protein